MIWEIIIKYKVIKKVIWHFLINFIIQELKFFQIAQLLAKADTLVFFVS